MNAKEHGGGLLTQANRRSPLTAGISSSRLGHSMWYSWWTKCGLGRFFSRFLPFSPTKNFIPPFLHTHLAHLVSFHFISPCDGVIGVVDRHPCYSQIFNIGSSSHLIPWLGPCRTRVEDFINKSMEFYWISENNFQVQNLLRNSHVDYLVKKIEDFLVTVLILSKESYFCNWTYRINKQDGN